MIEEINEIHSSLRGRFKDDLLRPGSVGYEDARATWNGMVSKKPGHGFTLRLESRVFVAKHAVEPVRE